MEEVEVIKYPAVVGMPRSGSRLTWQIVKHLIPERPENWEVKFLEDENLSKTVGGEQPPHWPVRTHLYVAGPPVIYTYRHPAEALLSLRAKYVYDIGKDGVDPDFDRVEATSKALADIGAQQNVHSRLKIDAAYSAIFKELSRDVLFLRYEDYFNNDQQRVIDIANFMNVPLTEKWINNILRDTSLECNFARGQALANSHPRQKFSGVEGLGGMQVLHVSPETMGVPNAWLKRHPGFWQGVVNNPEQPSLAALRDFCLQLDYRVDLSAFME